MPDTSQIPFDNELTRMCFGLFAFAGLAVNVLLLIRLMARPVSRQRLKNHLLSVPWELPDTAIIILPVLLVWAGFQCLMWLVDTQKIALPHIALPVRLLVAMFAFHVSILIATAWVMVKKKITLRQGFGFSWRGCLQYAGIGLVLGVAALPIVWIVDLLVEILLVRLGLDVSMQPVMHVMLEAASYPEWIQISLLGSAVIVAPLIEEILFRGILLPALSKTYGVAVGIALTSLLFGAMHMDVPSYLPLCFLSVILCIAYAYTGSIIVPFVIHSSFNLANLVLVWLTIFKHSA